MSHKTSSVYGISVFIKRVTRTVVMVLLLVIGAGVKAQENDSEKAHVMVSTNPLLYITEHLLAGKVLVTFPIVTDGDPSQWQPDANDVLKLQAADLIIINGAGHEPWLNLVSVPSKQVFDSSNSFHKAYIKMEQSVTHSHGPEGEHSHGRYAITTWMDMDQALKQAENIAGKLEAKWPEQKTIIEENLQILKQDLESLDKQYQELFDRLQSHTIVFSHPVYQYMERRYGINGYSVHWEPDSIPTQSQWQELKRRKDDNNAPIMIWEDTPLDETSNELKALGYHNVVVSPAANTNGNYDWMDIQKININNLRHLVEELR